VPSSKPKPGKSLAETHPELAAQADGWDPRTVTKGSHKKMGWICFFGHHWKSAIGSRARLGAGCPYCDGKLPVAGVSDLQTLFPTIAAQARGWDPSTVNPTSHKKREFECEFGHRYLQAVRRRIEATGCPVCQNDQIMIGVNDLATTHPHIANEADGWDPKTIVAGTPKKKPWKCSRGHKWIIAVNARAIKGNGCPYCSGRLPIVGETDLATTHPQIAAQLVEVNPKTIKAGTSSERVEWKCDRGHQWFATPAQRTGSKTDCPYCSGLKLIKGETDLATTHPGLAAQARGWDPSEYSKGSDKKVRWECTKGHQWDSVISSRVSGAGCPFCSGHQIIVGETDLATLYPEIAKEAFEWDPKTVGIGGGKRMWMCPMGHKYTASVHNRTYMGSGCSYCSNRKVLVGFNDLAFTNPELARQAHLWDPTTVTIQTKQKRKWKCEQGHVWETPVCYRQKSSCPYCSNKAVLTGFNDLKTTHPEIAVEAFGWDPTTVTAGSNKKLKWKCEKGHVWSSVVGSRAKGSQARRKASGCPSCAKFGFKPDSKAWLYFLEHSEMELFQIGIANDIKRRLEKHEAAGWKIVEVRGPMDGYLTKSLESAFLIAVRNRGGVIAKDIKLEKFDGYTEAWTKKSLNVTSIKQILDWVYEDEGNSAEAIRK